MGLDFPEVLVGLAEIAVALAGFTGVVVVFGSRSEGSWHPGDKLRLGFLLEASLTAGGFSLLALLLYSSLSETAAAWSIASFSWALYMVFSLYWSRLRIQENLSHHADVDRVANVLVFSVFVALVVIQLINALYWQQFGPLLAGLIVNLAGAAMQFARLIRSAFR